MKSQRLATCDSIVEKFVTEFEGVVYFFSMRVHMYYRSVIDVFSDATKKLCRHLLKVDKLKERIYFE